MTESLSSIGSHVTAEKQVSAHIRDYYDGHEYDPVQSRFGTKGPLHLPKPYCVYVLECEDYGTTEEFKTIAAERLDW